MPVEITVPESGESITEVQIGEWFKKEGDRVEVDEVIVEIETDKASMDLPCPTGGRLVKVAKRTGELAVPGEVIGYVEEGASGAESDTTSKVTKKGSAVPTAPLGGATVLTGGAADAPPVMPAARRALAERGIEAADLTGSGPGGRIRKEDVPPPAVPEPKRPTPPAPAPRGVRLEQARQEEVVPMTMLRRRIAERLVAAQQTAALLTTFNEIDMSAVADLRRERQEAFQAKHGVKLGFMSFFVKASIDALKDTPALNAEIRGTDLVYRNYHDIGVAVGTERGLVVPVIRSADRMSFAEIEKAIGDFSRRAADNKLDVADLEGGTFTISNGGIYGSLLSTPIVNPPQSGILGMHAIQQRPVAIDGQVVIRPMMYIALTYDHRVVDGRGAVTFLKRVKQVVEQPVRMLIEA